MNHYEIYISDNGSNPMTITVFADTMDFNELKDTYEFKRDGSVVAVFKDHVVLGYYCMGKKTEAQPKHADVH